ncbi:hypothetical protein LZ30DRAFT_699886 [Colletotrichum cereale]|nr:hypothetical protein LZ30DRAFT_699886 [Colletotrichum cereale]
MCSRFWADYTDGVFQLPGGRTPSEPADLAFDSVVAGKTVDPLPTPYLPSHRILSSHTRHCPGLKLCKGMSRPICTVYVCVTIASLLTIAIRDTCTLSILLHILSYLLLVMNRSVC